jgi:hypothetical protein
MQVAVRPRLTAGVALVGASLVVASTVAPVPDIHLPDMHLPALRTAEVGLAAAVNPLEVYAQVLQTALANAGVLAANAKPGQVLEQLLANGLNNVTTVGGGVATALTTEVPQLVQTAVTQIVAGNVAGAANALLQIPLAVGLPALPALLNPLQSVANVIKAFTADPLATELLVGGLLAPLISTPAAAATAIQNVISAAGTGNPMAVVGALLGAPATVADGLLNGGYGPDLGPLVGSTIPVKAGGLLSSAGLIFTPDGNFFVNTGGPIAAIEQILQKIAGALAPQAPTAAVKAAPADVASVPKAAPTTVTLTTGSTAVTAPAKATESTAATPAASPGTTESTSTTKDSTPKPETTEPSTEAKPSDKGTDVTTGNKVEPKTDGGSEASTKSGDESTSTATHESTTEKASATSATSAATSGAAEKGAAKAAGTASHARHGK